MMLKEPESPLKSQNVIEKIIQTISKNHNKKGNHTKKAWDYTILVLEVLGYPV
jgi:hypothetical protein